MANNPLSALQPDIVNALAQGGQKDPVQLRQALQKIYGPNIDDYIDQNGDFSLPLSGPVQPVGVKPLEGPGLGSAFKRGVLSTGQDALAAGGVVADWMNLPEVSIAAFQKAKELGQARDAIPRAVPRIEDVKTPGDFGTFVGETLAENAPFLLSLAIPGTVVAKGARIAGMAEGAASNLGWTTGFLADVGLMTGESAGTAMEAGGDPASPLVLGTGLGKAALDFVPFMYLANKLGVGQMVEKSIIKKLVEGGFVKRAAGKSLGLLVTEVPTEVAQEAMDIALGDIIQNKSLDLSEEDISRLKNAAAGAAAFSILGIPAALGKEKVEAKPETEKIPTPGEMLSGMSPEKLSSFTEDLGFELPTGNEGIGFDFRGMYDKKTGEPTATAESFQKILGKQNEAISYDPSLGVIFKPTQVSPERSGWTPGDAQFSSFYLDGGPEDAKAQLSKNPDGSWTGWLPYGVSVGTFGDLQTAMKATKESSSQGRMRLVLGDNGFVLRQMDEHSSLAKTSFLRTEKTPLDNAVIEIEKAKNRQAGSETTLPPSETNPTSVEARIPEKLRPLYEVRNQLLADPGNWRKDGELKNEVHERIKGIDTRIARLAELSGINSPVPSPAMTLNPKQRIEEALVERRKEETEKSTAKFPNLTDSESDVRAKLEDKELVEGLTGKEYQILEKLLAKSRGEGSRFGIYIDEKQALEELTKVVDKNLQKSLAADGTVRFMRSTRPTLTGAWAKRKDGSWNYIGKGQIKRIDGSSTQYEARVGEKAQVFESLREAKDFVEASVPVGPNTDPYTGKQHLDKASILQAVSKLWQGLQIRPAVTVAHPSEIYAKGSQLWKEAMRARGWIDFNEAGKVTIWEQSVDSAETAQKTFLHEVMAHFGLRAIFNKEELGQFLRLVGQTRFKEIAELRAFRPDLSGPITLTTAEEFVASKAEELYSGDPVAPYVTNLFDRLYALVRRALRRMGLNLKVSDKELLVMFKDINQFLRAGKPKDHESYGALGNLLGGARFKSAWTIIGNNGNYGPGGNILKAALLDDAPARQAIQGLDSLGEIWGAKFAGLFLSLLQIAERYRFPGVQTYTNKVQLWWARKRDITSKAVEVAKDWNGMPKRDASRLNQAIFEITNQSDEKKRRLSPEELASIFRTYNVTEQGKALYARVVQSFKDLLDHLQKGLEIAAIRSKVRDEVGPITGERAAELHKLWKENREQFLNELQTNLKNLEITGRLLEIEAEFKHLRDRDYFPYMRFGRYALYVRAKQDLSFGGKDFKGPTDGKRGQVVHFSTFESYRAREAGAKDLLGQFSDPSKFEIGAGQISDEMFTFLGMPPSLYETLEGELGLSSEQKDLLQEIYFRNSPGRGFLRHLTKREGVAGFSQDALRVYASYVANAANHIARVEYHQDMSDALEELRSAAGTMGDVSGVVRDYFGRHYRYLMNPTNDWAGIRSVGFLWYLGFNVKSALVNLTQVPMVAYPYLASKYGDGKAVASLSQTTSDVFKWARGKSLPNPEEEAALSRATAEGFRDESQATELAGLGESSVLQRLMPETKIQQRLMQLSHAGSFLFHHAENFNRTVTFLSAYRLAKEGGANSEQAFLAGRDAVQTAMFEYAKWNRPEFMRGKKSVFFLFWNYAQHLSYLAFGGRGSGTAMRLWLGLLLVAGIQGLPFAENVLDLIDWGSTTVKEKLGMKDPKTDLRLEMRELMGHLSDNPDLMMHGLSRQYGLGPLHLLALAGVPVPEVDVSASLSAGRVLPGTDTLTSSEPDPDKKLGQTLVDTLGPVAGIGYGFWRALTSTDPDKWKVWERAMPSAFASASKALRRGTRGAETMRGGAEIAKFDWANSLDRSEIVANALGFSPTKLSRVYEQRAFQQDLKQYWSTRRALVMENYAFGVLSKDQEVMSDVREALKRFNDDAPSPQLKIGGDDIIKSLRQRTKLRSLREDGLPDSRAFVPLYRRVAAAYGSEGSSLPPQ